MAAFTELRPGDKATTAGHRLPEDTPLSRCVRVVRADHRIGKAYVRFNHLPEGEWPALPDAVIPIPTYPRVPFPCYTGDVRAVGQGIRAGGLYGELYALADALEEAGCTDQTILDSCREGQRWVIDQMFPTSPPDPKATAVPGTMVK